MIKKRKIINKKNILVTGGSGFIVINLIDKLYKKKNKLLTTYFKKKIKKIRYVTYLRGDLRKYNFCDKITKKIDTSYVYGCFIWGQNNRRKSNDPC